MYYIYDGFNDCAAGGDGTSKFLLQESALEKWLKNVFHQFNLGPIENYK